MASRLFDLTGRVALVTGSTRGIGLAIATAMAEQGARVVISSRKADACREVAERLRSAGHEALDVPAHVGDTAQLAALVERVLAQWGRIDDLVCNAAVNPYFGPLHEISDDAYARIMDVNVGSVLRLTRLVIPQMAERGDGTVTVLSSIAGFIGDRMLGAYGIAKAAQQQLVRNLAVEWGERGVRVNAIAPGVIRTDFSRALWESEEIHGATVARTALGRIGEPDEIAGAAVYFASPAGRYTTGTTLVVDGGYLIRGDL